MSVGTEICESTELGETELSNAISWADGLPLKTEFLYALHHCSIRVPHSPSAGFCKVANERKVPVHTFLNGPGSTRSFDDCGKSAWLRLFQVISAIAASTLLSAAAVKSAAAPPYEAPTIPTTGSLPLSFFTSLRVARYEINF